MKKLAYLSALVLGFGMAACSDYHEPHPSIPTTPGVTTGISAEGVTLTPSAAVGEGTDLNTIDLEGYLRINIPIQVAEISIDPETFNAAYSNFRVVPQLSKTEDFASPYTLEDVTYQDGIISVNPAEVDRVYRQMVGKNPAERIIYARYAIYAQSATTDNIRLGGDNFYFGPEAIKILPVDLGLEPIDQNYFIYGSANNWDESASSLVKFGHSEADAYDDPVFTTVINVTNEIINSEGGWMWMIVPESAIDTATDTFDSSKLYGPQEGMEQALDGALVQIDATVGMVTVPGPYIFTINMSDHTYEIKAAYPYLYSPGGANGWNQNASLKLPTTDYETYQGFLLIDGEFKLTSQPNWDGVNFGYGGDGILSTDGGADNIKATDGAGLYFFSANIVAMTYKAPIKIESLGMIGGFNGWGAQEALTPDASGLVWTGTLTLDDEEEWKFRGNDNWDINLGGDLNDLTVGGANIKTPAGTYIVTLDLSKLPYSATVVADEQ